MRGILCDFIWTFEIFNQRKKDKKLNNPQSYQRKLGMQATNSCHAKNTE